VRGTTLKQSIIRIADRLNPKQIIIVSSAPQIRYPDCYGIDMSKLGEFVAFKAALALIKDKGMNSLIDEIYQSCMAYSGHPKEDYRNEVQRLYKPFSQEEISEKIAEIITPEGINAKVKVIYQSIESLRRAVPNHTGDWYFTGDYPTPGGDRVVCRSFINFVEGRNERGYE
jgi:amidophosphoribosyltransferase